jgi:hypothetical protein
MTNELLFSVKDISDDQLSSINFDIGIFGLGFESRCIFRHTILNKNCRNSIAIGFDYGQCTTYEKNNAYYQASMTKVEIVSDNQYVHCLKEEFKILNDVQELKILFDITSFNRYRIAAFIELIQDSFKNKIKLDIYFTYSFSKYTPYVPNEKPITFSNYVSEKFSGWPSVPDRPLSLILGLGYESDRATGVFEFLEPTNVWALLPVGGEGGFDADVIKANVLLWDQVKEHTVEYSVNSPQQLFLSLDSVCSGCLRTDRVIILPQGPKLFTLCSLLVALLRTPEVGIWRISHQRDEVVVDRVPSGRTANLMVSIRSSTHQHQ